MDIRHSKGLLLHEQVFRLIQQQILSGEKGAGERLGSSRMLAEQLGVSRNTVLTAIARLEAEGYIRSRPGSGYYVQPRLVLNFEPSALKEPPPLVGFKPYRSDIIDFRSGLPDLSSFPVKTWAGLYREVMEEITPIDLGYNQPEGRAELRREIAVYLQNNRGVRCSHRQIVITSGTTQAIGLVGGILLKDRQSKAVILEDPITSDIQRILRGCGGILHPGNVDDAGLDIRGTPGDIKAALIYVTPSHQFPLGYTMPIQRRVDLIDYARETGAYIVEDDYDSEYRYNGHPISSIQGICPSKVIYIGSFSKTISPALRIGFVVFPGELIESGRQAKWFTDLHNSVFDQLTLTKFLRKQQFHRHISKMGRIYREKRNILLAALERRFSSRVQIIGDKAGLHLCARFPGLEFSDEVLRELLQKGCKVYPVEEHAIRKGSFGDTIILGFGMLSPERLVAGVEILGDCLDRIRGS